MANIGRAVTNVDTTANQSIISLVVLAYFWITKIAVTIGTTNGLKITDVPKAIQVGNTEEVLCVINYSFGVSRVLKKFTKSNPCVTGLTSLSIFTIFPALSIITVKRFSRSSSGFFTAPKSRARFFSVSTKSGKFRSFSSVNF